MLETIIIRDKRYFIIIIIIGVWYFLSGSDITRWSGVHYDWIHISLLVVGAGLIVFMAGAMIWVKYTLISKHLKKVGERKRLLGMLEDSEKCEIITDGVVQDDPEILRELEVKNDIAVET